MQVLTEKRHTEDVAVELRFLGPIGKRNEAVDTLKALGFIDTTETIPWRDCFPYTDEQLPGICLTGARHKEGVTQREFSEMTGIPQRHISEMENNKRSIGKEMAKKLGKALNISYKVFL
jgi:DNA-binding transcriptional regulator YiaG